MTINGDSLTLDQASALAAWNETAAPYPTDRCIHHLVEEQAARTPGATAVIFENYRLTYAALNRRANQLAHYLRGLGVGRETLVGVCTNRSPDMLVAMLGILKAGGAYVALDPAYPKVRQAFMIEDAAMPIVLTQEELVDSLPVAKANYLCMDKEWGAIAQSAGEDPAVAMDQRQLAYILYTSGSTGRPKGVAIEHRSVVAFLSWAKSVFTPDELAGTLAATSICFDLSVFEIFLPLASGGAIVLAQNAVALPVLPAREQVTLINTVPSAMAALVSVGGVPKSVRVVNLAGEPLPNKLVQDIYRLGTIEKVYNLYGPSEDTTYSTFVLTEKGATTNPTIGRPIANTQVHIIDESLEPVPIGASGELCLAGDGLARGYLNRPEMTAEKFIPNPFGPGRLYRTGDLARYLPDGNIEFLGRKDYQVKVRGFRIELGEIETALEQHEAVERAVVLALPDARNEQRLVGFLVPRGGVLETLAKNQDAEEHVALWQNVYEAAYSQSPVPEDPTFNTTGWQSSYTGQPIPSAEMREWLTRTVDRILALQPRNVLEIGCGTGMLLARIAPKCDTYIGLDFSATALDRIRSMQQTIRGLDRVTLMERAADELGDFAPQSVDTIVINSVAQHFPDVDYLVRVLTEAFRLVKPGGHIFIGDVINLFLLETFHTSVQVYRAADHDSATQVKQRIRQHMAHERDLTLAPPFFLSLAQQQPSIAHVEALPKSGQFHNQLTRFRYDAILHVGDKVETNREFTWMDWRRQRLTIGEVRRLLEARPETLAIRNIPNARLDEEVTEMAWLQEAAPEEKIAQLRAYLAQQPGRGIEPDAIRSLASEGSAGEDSGYHVELSWLNVDAGGTFDAVFTRRDQPTRFASFTPDGGGVRSWRELANHPKRAKLNRELIPLVQQFLREKLPQYMVPATFTILDQLPLSPTGKIDRRALAQLPAAADQISEQTLPESLSPIEQLLVSIWADTLNLNHVGVHDDFFALGGNSLTAMALMHQLQQRLHHSLRPQVLIEAPTVAEFAAYLQETFPDVAAELAPPSPIVPDGAAAVEEGEI